MKSSSYRLCAAGTRTWARRFLAVGLVAGVAATECAYAQGTLPEIARELKELKEQVSATVQVPVGTLLPFGGDVTSEASRRALAEKGWLVCDGASQSTDSYGELYEVLGLAFGGDKAKGHFNLPDLRGRFVRGVNAGASRDPDAATRGLGAPGGNTGNEVGSVQDDALQGHWHATSAINGDREGNFGGGAGSKPKGNGAWVHEPITDNANGVPRISSETRSKNLYVNWIIKARQGKAK